MAQVITLGESMVVFTPESYGALRYEHSYRSRLAGAESNTAIGLAKLGISSSWMSRLGTDEFGQYVLNMIRAEGVDTSAVVMDPEHRTGIMFKQREYGGETTVYYYRENSAASHLRPQDLKEEWFQGAEYLHLSGITPVLSRDCLETVLAAVAMAHKNGIKISFDPNIRKKLWNGQNYTDLFRELTFDANVVMMGLEEAEVLFGTNEIPVILDTVFSMGEAQAVAIKDGGNGATVASREEQYHIPPFPCKPLEPVGAGDGFNAGFLAGLIEKRPLQVCGQMGGIAGALATQSTGDMEGYPSRERMERLLAGQGEVYR